MIYFILFLIAVYFVVHIPVFLVAFFESFNISFFTENSELLSVLVIALTFLSILFFQVKKYNARKEKEAARKEKEAEEKNNRLAKEEEERLVSEALVHLILV